MRVIGSRNVEGSLQAVYRVRLLITLHLLSEGFQDKRNGPSQLPWGLSEPPYSHEGRLPPLTSAISIARFYDYCKKASTY